MLQEKQEDASFLLEIDDVYSIRGKGVAVCGRVVRGHIAIGDIVEVVGLSIQAKQAKIANMTQTIPGLPTCVLEGVTRQEIQRGQVLATPGSIKPATTFWAEVYFDERVRKIDHQPFQGNWRHSFHLRHTDIYGTLSLPKGKETITHGDRFVAKIELNEPCALEVGLSFVIGVLVGQGTVTEIIG